MQQRTNLSNIHLIIVVLATSIILHSGAESISDDNEPVCETEFCREIANEIITSMDDRADPCNDFYKYACGNWHKKLTDKNSKLSQFTTLNNKTKFHLKTILESEPSVNDNLSVVKVKELYRVCMDTSTIEKRGLVGLMELIEQQGGWPLTMTNDEWKQREKTWQDIDTSINKIIGDSRFFRIHVKVDIQNTSSHIITLSTPRLNDPPNFLSLLTTLDGYMELDSVKNYRNLVTKVARIIANERGFSISKGQLNIDVKSIVAFEAELYNITLVQHNETKPDVNESYNKISINQLQEAYDSVLGEIAISSKINWLDRIRSVFSIIPEIQIDGSTLVAVTPMRYFLKLAKLLRETPPKVIVNTMQWWMIKQLLPYTNQEMDDLLEKPVSNESESPSVQQPRWMYCTSLVALQHALGFAYVERHFPEDSKIAVLDMVHEIAHEMGEDIRRSSWLDSNSKQSALEKLDAMKEFIGFPDWYSDKKVVEDYYDGLVIGKHHLENNLAIRQFGLQLNSRLLNLPVDRKKWRAAPTDVNAFYYYPGNSLTIPAAILQAPFFSRKQPDALNYGGIGSVIGHEISHGFDDIGRQYDKDGNLRNWWSNDTINQFKQRTDCFISKYKKFGVVYNNTNYRINPMISLSENIADSTGVRAVYKAFETHSAQSSSPNMRLPGLENLSTRQLFFLSYAHTFCEAMSFEAVLNLIKTNAHCPAAFRITGTLSNIQEFAESFQCSQGSTMNPKVRCGIWY